MPVYSVPQAKLDAFLTQFKERSPSEQSGTHVVRVHEKAQADFPEHADGHSSLVAIVLIGPLTDEQMSQATALMYTVRR